MIASAYLIGDAPYDHFPYNLPVHPFIFAAASVDVEHWASQMFCCPDFVDCWLCLQGIT